MAIITNTNEPFVVNALEEVQPLPIGELRDTVIVNAPLEKLSPPFVLANRFPTPPSAFAFLTDVEMFAEFPIEISGVESPYVITGALYPESGFLEPTIGQIWPRIG